jgi:hypothetical protein
MALRFYAELVGFDSRGRGGGGLSFGEEPLLRKYLIR